MFRVLNINSHSAIRVIPWLDPPGSLIAAGTQVDKRRQKETVIVSRIRGCFSWHRHIHHTCFFSERGCLSCASVPSVLLLCGVLCPLWISDYLSHKMHCTGSLAEWAAWTMRRGHQRRIERRREDTCRADITLISIHMRKSSRGHIWKPSGAAVQELSSGWASLAFYALLRTPREEGGANSHTQDCAPVCTVAVCEHLCPPVNITSLQTKCVISLFIIEHPHMGGWKRQWPHLLKPPFSWCLRQGCTKLKNWFPFHLWVWIWIKLAPPHRKNIQHKQNILGNEVSFHPGPPKLMS